MPSWGHGSWFWLAQKGRGVTLLVLLPWETWNLRSSTENASVTRRVASPGFPGTVPGEHLLPRKVVNSGHFYVQMSIILHNKLLSHVLE